MNWLLYHWYNQHLKKPLTSHIHSRLASSIYVVCKVIFACYQLYTSCLMRNTYVRYHMRNRKEGSYPINFIVNCFYSQKSKHINQENTHSYYRWTQARQITKSAEGWNSCADRWREERRQRKSRRRIPGCCWWTRRRSCSTPSRCSPPACAPASQGWRLRIRKLLITWSGDCNLIWSGAHLLSWLFGHHPIF